MTEDQAPEWAQQIAADVFPLHTRFLQNTARVLNLVRIAQGLHISPKVGNLSFVTDLLRAAVVLLHASLEDFLRGVALIHLPFAPEATLDTIPLIGSKGQRPEKFFLGRLAQHRESTVDDIIRASIAEHLERTTYNSVEEVMILLESLHFEIKDRGSQPLAEIDALMKRRHQIVHRADRVAVGKDQNDAPAALAVEQVERWLKCVNDFGGWIWAHATLQIRLRQLNIDPFASGST